MKSLETFKKVFAYIKKYHFFLLLSFVLSFVAVVTQLYICLLYTSPSPRDS